MNEKSSKERGYACSQGFPGSSRMSWFHGHLFNLSVTPPMAYYYQFAWTSVNNNWF